MWPVRGLLLRRRVLVGSLLLALVPFGPSDPVRAGVGVPAGARVVSWTTYGFDAARTGSNPEESVLGPGTVGALHALWRVPLGAASITQPVVAADVRVRGHVRQVAYAGTERGDLVAVDAVTGTELWRHGFGSVHTSCPDLPGSVFGISGTPVLDPASGRVYVADSNQAGVSVYAVDAATGAVAPGWPVTVSLDPTHVHVWGALTLSGGLLYAATAGMCDLPPYYGRVFAIDVAAGRVAALWSVVQDDDGSALGGGGIWGYGGASIDPASGDVLVATGNALFPQPQRHPYAERVVRLSPRLALVSSSFPGRLPGFDVDFGATPVPFAAPGCPAEVAAMNKTGQLFVFRMDRIGAGPVQRIPVSSNESGRGLGLFIGLPAYDAGDRMLYVANPGPDGRLFRHGVVAFHVGRDCMLHAAWQRAVGPNGTTTVSSPTVANGVVYEADGAGGEVFALDAGTGEPLWSSGDVIEGPVFAAPTVVTGRLYVAAWNQETGGALVAFGM